MDKVPTWVVDLGVGALLRIVQSQSERRKWAKALAKLFLAIRNAADQDTFLEAAITTKDKREV